MRNKIGKDNQRIEKKVSAASRCIAPVSALVIPEIGPEVPSFGNCAGDSDETMAEIIAALSEVEPVPFEEADSLDGLLQWSITALFDRFSAAHPAAPCRNGEPLLVPEFTITTERKQSNCTLDYRINWPDPTLLVTFSSEIPYIRMYPRAPYLQELSPGLVGYLVWLLYGSVFRVFTPRCFYQGAMLQEERDEEMELEEEEEFRITCAAYEQEVPPFCFDCSQRPESIPEAIAGAVKQLEQINAEWSSRYGMEAVSAGCDLPALFLRYREDDPVTDQIIDNVIEYANEVDAMVSPFAIRLDGDAGTWVRSIELFFMSLSAVSAIINYLDPNAGVYRHV